MIQFQILVVNVVPHVTVARQQQFVKLGQMDHCVVAHQVLPDIQKQQDASQSVHVPMATKIALKQQPVLMENVLINVTVLVDQIWHASLKITKPYVCARTDLNSFQMMQKMDV